MDDLKLEKPCHSLFQEQRNIKNEGTWKSKLLAIKPGKGERSKEYEDICIEILKNVLGEYLGLSKVQESSNNGLYRFDLCCKIKNGVNQDFFDTIKNYFNTKLQMTILIGTSIVALSMVAVYKNAVARYLLALMMFVLLVATRKKWIPELRKGKKV